MERLIAQEGDLSQSVPRQSITPALADEIDVSRAGVICSADAPARVTDQFDRTANTPESAAHRIIAMLEDRGAIHQWSRSGTGWSARRPRTRATRRPVAPDRDRAPA